MSSTATKPTTADGQSCLKKDQEPATNRQLKPTRRKRQPDIASQNRNSKRFQWRTGRHSDSRSFGFLVPNSIPERSTFYLSKIHRHKHSSCEEEAAMSYTVLARILESMTSLSSNGDSLSDTCSRGAFDRSQALTVSLPWLQERSSVTKVLCARLRDIHHPDDRRTSPSDS